MIQGDLFLWSPFVKITITTQLPQQAADPSAVKAADPLLIYTSIARLPLLPSSKLLFPTLTDTQKPFPFGLPPSS